MLKLPLTSSSLALLLVFVSTGCQWRSRANCPSPSESGIYGRDLIDPAAQHELDELMRLKAMEERALKIRDSMQKAAPQGRPQRNVLCLSGGGSLGAYSAGVICGWTERGDRPVFDVVTGISTGALIAPFAFLGPKYDPEIKRFYTTLSNDDLFEKHLIRGLLGESLTDNAPLGRQIDQSLTPEFIAELAAAHAEGRRLYIGTTAAEEKRFVVWDMGAIASRNGAGDRELLKQIMLGSAAIPGFFPPSKIDVYVDGKCYTEKHVDGGVSQGIFFHPPYTSQQLWNDPSAMNLAGTKVWAIVAGKLYADPEVIKPRSLSFAAKNISTVIYAQTRGDLQRMYLVSLLNGMDLSIAAIPAGYPAPRDAANFDPEEMGPLFEEGRRQIRQGTAWRTSPPGTLEAEGEPIQARAGRCLTFEQRGPILPIPDARGRTRDSIPYPTSDQGIPAVPPIKR
jgi:predicted patatin/cPLA2 family phospholipase